MKRRWIFQAMVAGMISVAAHADRSDELDHVEARALVADGTILSLEAILALHPQQLQGHLLDVELEREHDQIIYELEILGDDGWVREFEIDAADGTVLDIEREKP